MCLFPCTWGGGGDALTNLLKLNFEGVKQLWDHCWLAKSLVIYKDIFYVFYDYGVMLKIL